ncbi:aldo/keto reductase [Agromyces larvae]|uniref:Aldo/keto reductase n=1 Tax=Agromyces larvae TaxID=2929802 RepID=A0ABY4BZH8_9MICO|nr:aldo/keto reductase [Agromyces larvae]UOE43123.1 aldo/keto reductase [Agromyces larvae]
MTADHHASIPDVALGDGLVVPAQGFGGMALSGSYGQVDPDAALATLHHAVDAGVRFIDTANIYGRGENERLVARLLADRRDEVVLATKVGILPQPDADGVRFRGDRAYLRESVRASLERLGTERIDLYYLHRVDPRVPIEDSVGALAELVTEGLVGRIGVSEVTADELERAVAVHPIAAVQSEWSLWSRDVEAQVIPAARRLGVGFVAYSPLGRGFFAGGVSSELPVDDARRRFPRFGEQALAQNLEALAVAERAAEREGLTRAQVALAWVYARGRELDIPVVPIPGTRRPERIDENLVAVGARLSAETLAELDALAGLVEGERAPSTNGISAFREAAAPVVPVG